IHTVAEYINQHINEHITLDTLASQVHLSKYHFARLFKETTRMTVRDYIIQKRLILACEMIWAGEPLKNIYNACGFTDYSSFYRNFKSFYGLSPSEYKEFYDKGPAND
ncbi:MAG: helix-turn-helix transcriptional regulator, partial [Clostridiaceae bacterium]|nr:helix-turn-helix transcriptional regulator [Clostridiaceae bacterium]